MSTGPRSPTFPTVGVESETAGRQSLRGWCQAHVPPAAVTKVGWQAFCIPRWADLGACWFVLADLILFL